MCRGWQKQGCSTRLCRVVDYLAPFSQALYGHWYIRKPCHECGLDRLAVNDAHQTRREASSDITSIGEGNAERDVANCNKLPRPVRSAKLLTNGRNDVGLSKNWRGGDSIDSPRCKYQQHTATLRVVYMSRVEPEERWRAVPLHHNK